MARRDVGSMRNSGAVPLEKSSLKGQERQNYAREANNKEFILKKCAVWRGVSFLLGKAISAERRRTWGERTLSKGGR